MTEFYKLRYDIDFEFLACLQMLLGVSRTLEDLQRLKLVNHKLGEIFEKAHRDLCYTVDDSLASQVIRDTAVAEMRRITNEEMTLFSV